KVRYPVCTAKRVERLECRSLCSKIRNSVEKLSRAFASRETNKGASCRISAKVGHYDITGLKGTRSGRCRHSSGCNSYTIRIGICGDSFLVSIHNEGCATNYRDSIQTVDSCDMLVAHC